jgi:hypothetical protein
MAYLLRFVQRYSPANKKEFLALEKEFAQLERTTAGFPKGKRYLPYAGREPGNTLIWECEFPTMNELHQALSMLEKDEQHEALYRQQVPYFLEAYTEIYESFS